jgi:MFS family permease
LQSLRQRRRTLALVSIASAAWAFCFGLGLPLGSLWLRDAGCNATDIGLCSSAYYLAVAVTSLFVPFLMGRRTRIVVVAGMIVDGVTVMFFPLAHDLTSWLTLRLCGGLATALCLIPMETVINRNAASATRARDFSIYAVSVALGVAVGSVVGLQLYPLAPGMAFLFGGAAALFGAGLIGPGFPTDGISVVDCPQEHQFSLRSNLLSLGTAWAQGFMEAAMLTFLSAYLLGLGYTETVASALLGGLFIGVVIVQVPGAWLADKVGRLRIVVACHLVVLTGLVLLPVAQGTLPLAILLFAVGASAAALYPLGLALLGERVPPQAMARANSWYLASNCTGSLMGPWISGKLIDEIGPPGLFITSFASCALVLVAWLAIGIRTSALDQSLSPIEQDRQAA